MIRTRLKGTSRRLLKLALVAALAASSSLAADAGTAVAGARTVPKRGGTVTDLLNAGVWSSLYPATDHEEGENTSELSAIYGQLFELGPNGSIVPSEAKSYKFSKDGLTADIYLRSGIKFSDGTPFNAQAVVDSIKTDLEPQSACPCLANLTSVESETAVGDYHVRIQLSKPDSALIAAFIDEAPNWTPSPTALAAEGPAQFGIKPVGAGPFMVTSDEIGVKLTTVRNPHYFVKGEPYLAGVNFLVTSSDQSDFGAIQTGQAQMTLLTTTSIYQTAQGMSGIKTYKFPAMAPDFVRLNTLVAPFNNPMAREAVSYATDTKALVRKLFGNLYKATEGYIPPGGLFYTGTVPNYRGYNLAKAKKLVAELGGLSIQLQSTNNTQVSSTLVEAIAAMWEEAGIKVTIAIETNAYTISERENKVGWQAMEGGFLCGIDPSSCLGTNLASNGLFSAIKDPKVDRLINQGVESAKGAVRQRVYRNLQAYLNSQAYMVWLYGANTLMVASSNLQGVDPSIPVPVGFDDWATAWLK